MASVTQKRQEKIQEFVNDARSRMMRNYKPVVSFDKNEYIGAFWDQQTLADVQKMEGIIDRSAIASYEHTFDIVVDLKQAEHPVPEDLFFTCVIRASCNSSSLYPRITQDGLPVSLQPYAEQAVKIAYERGVLVEATNWLTSNFDNYADIRYVFPPIMMMLRHMGNHEEAAKIEVARAPRKPFSLPPHIQRYVRWLNQWFAMHELIGTFEPKDTTIEPAGQMKFSIVGDYSRPAKIDKGLDVCRVLIYGL